MMSPLAKQFILILLAVSCLLLVYQYMQNTTNSDLPKYLSYERIESFVKQLGNSIHSNSKVYIKRKETLSRVVDESQNALRDDDYEKKNNISKDFTHMDPTRSKLKVCRPMTYVLFLKTHKTGSSTITNILNRYADTQNLTLLLPRYRQSYSFQWPNKFRFSAAADTFSRPNILANHARYSREAMHRVFPRETTFYMTILRNPVDQFESSFQFFSFAYMLNIQTKKNPEKYFLDNPPYNAEIVSLAKKYPALHLIRNPLFYDLGLDYKDYDNHSIVSNAINTIESDFNVVLLMEHFDESLTLMRRRLCWEVDDVVYFKLNERLSKNRRAHESMSDETITKIKNWNNADMALYKHFEHKFWIEIYKEGPDFHADVLRLKARRQYYTEACIEDEAIEEAYSQVYVKGYKMRTNLDGEMKRRCESMLRNEIKYLNIFKEQYARWHDKLETQHIENFQNVLPSNSHNPPLNDVLDNFVAEGSGNEINDNLSPPSPMQQTPL